MNESIELSGGILSQMIQETVIFLLHLRNGCCGLGWISKHLYNKNRRPANLRLFAQAFCFLAPAFWPKSI
jgi:hypothetical protein